MEYQKDEEKKQLYNQSQNKASSESLNKPNLNILQNNKPKAEWIYVNPTIYIMYCLLNGLSLTAGCFLKLIYPISRTSIGKNSILTGIPIIRNYFFVFPILLNTIYFIWCLYKYFSNISIRTRFEKNIFQYLKTIRGAFFFTNIALLLIFYLIYFNVVLYVYKGCGFKLSGHTIASILSGGMIVNLHNTYMPFINLNIDPNFNKYISYINMFLYYHSIYTVFWSAWIFHQVTELIIAFFISVISLVLIHVINVDELILNLFDCNYPKKNRIII